MKVSQSTLRSFADISKVFRELEPWKYWFESQYFGVENLESGEIDWLSVMGSQGEHRSLAMYLGNQGFQILLKLLQGPTDFQSKSEMFDRGMNQLMLKVFYGNKNEMDREDLEIFKKLNFKPQGQHHYFQARSFRPYQFPVLPNEEQFRYMIYLLKISIQVFQENQKGGLKLEEGNRRLIIRSLKDSGNLDFYYSDLPTQEDVKPLPVLHPFLLQRVKKDIKPEVDFEHCFGVIVLPRPIKEEEDEFPVFPSLFFSIMRGSGFVHRIELVKDSNDIGALQKFVLEEITALEKIPATILVDSDKAALALEALCQQLDIEILLAAHEPEFTNFVNEIMEME